MVNAISGSVVSSLNQVIHSTSEAVFMSSVLPSFERVCQEMYRQIDEAFKRGTAECKRVLLSNVLIIYVVIFYL